MSNLDKNPSASDVDDAIDTYQDAVLRMVREAIFGADDDKPSASVAAGDARRSLSDLLLRKNVDDWLLREVQALRIRIRPGSGVAPWVAKELDRIIAEVARLEGA